MTYICTYRIYNTHIEYTYRIVCYFVDTNVLRPCALHKNGAQQFLRMANISFNLCATQNVVRSSK